MEPIGAPATIQTMLQWLGEAQSAHSEWRRQSWEDWEFRDGVQWSQAAFDELQNKGVNPLTINRIFPILNLLYGNFILNLKDLVAKGRTKNDNELAQVMSESLAYVKDQNRGQELINSAFTDEITAGYGCIQVGKNSDPRNEPVQWKRQPWFSVWWDPYASPWLEKDNCRYVFTAAWKNIEDLIMLFPEKQKEIEETCSNIAALSYLPFIHDDQGTTIEEYHRFYSANQWVNTERKRVRPVEMWYTVIKKGWFAIMPDARVIDLDTIQSTGEQFQVVQQSHELVSAYVKRLRVATFLGDLKLQDIPTPYKHDLYPFVPFIGYLDRFNRPFGVPRQIKEQNLEVNKRRSMALALINNRRIIAEEGAARDVNKAYSESNRFNGLVLLNKGKMDKWKIEEMGQLAAPQIALMNQSEKEIQEIVGANDEALGKESKLQSGVALEKKASAAASVTASLLDNALISQRRLGELTMAMVQTEWTGPKVLRVVDRISGVEKFIELNQKMYDASTGAITISNNLTEGRFDVIVAHAPMTDTMREKNMELLFGAINKAPPEAIGPLLNAAFEISDIPNKDAILKQIRAATGQPETNGDLTQEEQNQIAQQEAMAAKQAQQQDQAMKQQEQEFKIAEIAASIDKKKAEARALEQKSVRDDWEMGFKIGQTLTEGGKPSDTTAGKKV